MAGQAYDEEVRGLTLGREGEDKPEEGLRGEETSLDTPTDV